MARICCVLTGPASSTGSPMTFMMRPRVSSPTGTEIGSAGVGDFLSAHQAFGRVHRDRAHRVLAEVLRHLEHQAVAVVVGLKRVQNRRQVLAELNVHDGAGDLRDAAGDAFGVGRGAGGSRLPSCRTPGRASADARGGLDAAGIAGRPASCGRPARSVDEAEDERAHQTASAPEMISMSSLVICA